MGLSRGVFGINGEVYVEINTSGQRLQPVEFNRHPCQRTAMRSRSARRATFLSLLNLQIAANATYNSATNDFTLAFEGTASVSILFFSATANFGGWIDSDGQFAVGLQGGAGIDAGIVSISGSAYIGIDFSKGAVTWGRVMICRYTSPTEMSYPTARLSTPAPHNSVSAAGSA